MLCSITVELGDPGGDNEVLQEALNIINAKPLACLRRNQHWLAQTDLFSTPDGVRRFLLGKSKDDDRIEVLELPRQDMTERDQVRLSQLYYRR